MSSKKLSSHLSTILRKTPRHTAPPQFSSNPSIHNQSSPIFTLSSYNNPQTFSRHHNFPDELPSFSGKFNYCSKIGEKCWNCNAPAFLFCDSCRSIQPVDRSVDYFQIFGLDRKYKFDDKNLEGMYKDWQKKLHPDLVHSKSEKEKEYAAEQSARVIDAYRTLQKPLSRAIYILSLEGIDVDQEQTISESDLLAEILELREEVEDAADSHALMKIQSQVQVMLKHWSESFASAFQRRSFEEAKSSIQRMNYYVRVNEEIEKKL